MKLSELMDTVSTDVTQHCLRITDEQHQQLRLWHWLVDYTLSWWLHWLSVGLVIERSLVRLPAGALSSQLGQLSLPSLRGR